MSLDSKKIIPYLIVILPLSLVLSIGFFMSSFYVKKVTDYFTTAKADSLQHYIDVQKVDAIHQLKQLILFLEYTKNRIEPELKEELEKEVLFAYTVAQKIYNKHHGKKSSSEIKKYIKNTLNEITYNGKSHYIFITDYDANMILIGSHLIDKKIALYKDADHRSIVFEEIQTVRKYGEGYIKSRRGDTQEEEMIFVKNLGLYDWYIGASSNINVQEKKLKDKLINMIKSIPLKGSDFITLSEGDRELYSSKNSTINMKELQKNYYYVSKYYEPFNWSLVYGFDATVMSEKDRGKYKKFEEILVKEYDFAVKVFIGIILITLLLSLLLSLSVNKIFRNYQNKVAESTLALEKLHNSYKEKV